MATINLSKTSYSYSVIKSSGSFYSNGKKSTGLSNSTDLTDTITGGNGQDYIEAMGGDDTVIGGNGKDEIYGGAGNDTLSGDGSTLDPTEDNAKDIIYGGEGSDTINGGNGADMLYGDGKNTGGTTEITQSYDAADDILDNYNDTINGGNGPDTIIGGLGGDTLTGGSGPDTFIYDRIADSRSTDGETVEEDGDSADDWQSATGDYITDFTKGSDKLDFTKLNTDTSGALHFSGATPDTYGIWYWKDSTNGFTYVFADTNGNGKADMAIKVKGEIDFGQSDFVGVNDAPTSTDDSVTTLEDTAVVLGLGDFGTFADVDGDSIAAVKITTLASDGSLEWYNGSAWVAVTLNQEISATDITGGNLRFVPDTNENGTGYATIDFKVGDGTDFSASAYTLTVDVTPVNDAPTSTADSVTTLEDTSVLLGLSDFGTYADVESDPLASVKITTLASDGSLEYYNGVSWVAVTLNQEISAADITGGNLRFVPDANENGTGYATIGFKVGDGTDFSASAYTLTVDVTAVDDPLPPASVTVASPYTGPDADPNDFDSATGTQTVSGITGTSSADTIIGTNGNDTNIEANSGADTVYAGSGNDTIYGESGSDNLYGQTGTDTVYGGTQNDFIYGGSGDDTIDGGNGDDNIYGGSGSDTITGSDNDDNIIGGYGADLLTGAGGNDVFKFLSNRDTGDTITDFNQSGNDTLDFSAIGGITGSSAAFSASVTANSVNYFQGSGANSADTIIWADTDGVVSTVELQVILTGVTAASLTSADFVL